MALDLELEDTAGARRHCARYKLLHDLVDVPRLERLWSEKRWCDRRTCERLLARRLALATRQRLAPHAVHPTALAQHTRRVVRRQRRTSGKSSVCLACGCAYLTTSLKSEKNGWCEITQTTRGRQPTASVRSASSESTDSRTLCLASCDQRNSDACIRWTDTHTRTCCCWERFVVAQRKAKRVRSVAAREREREEHGLALARTRRSRKHDGLWETELRACAREYKPAHACAQRAHGLQ